MDYSPEVERRFASPCTAGGAADSGPGGATAAGEAEDRVLNVWVRFEVQVSEGRISDIHFRVFGCPHTIAAASWAAEHLRGAGVAALRGVDVGRMSRDLDVPPEKLGKLLRVEDALLACADALAPAGT